MVVLADIVFGTWKFHQELVPLFGVWCTSAYLRALISLIVEFRVKTLVFLVIFLLKHKCIPFLFARRQINVGIYLGSMAPSKRASHPLTILQQCCLLYLTGYKCSS